MINKGRILEELIDALLVYPNINVTTKTTSLYLHANPLAADLLKAQYNIDFALEGGIKVVENENIISTTVISILKENTTQQRYSRMTNKTIQPFSRFTVKLSSTQPF